LRALPSPVVVTSVPSGAVAVILRFVMAEA
jgi:hypothetical protein